MRKVSRFSQQLREQPEGGQAIVEYIIMLSLALIVMGALSIGLRGSIYRLWDSFTKEIAAGCPGCSAPGE